MLYLNTTDIQNLGLDWWALLDKIEEACECLSNDDYAQPLKPYLRYGNANNRIIAMPAYVGGKIASAGIKWIASYPQNVQNGLPRAHSNTILNDSLSGKPVCLINDANISAIRTAAVSGLFLSKIMRIKSAPKLIVGIIGFGVVGKFHAHMLQNILGTRMAELLVYDTKMSDKLSMDLENQYDITVCDNWQSIIEKADIVITCTISQAPFINSNPKPNSVHLNISLRDYHVNVMRNFNCVVVDDWSEVCRENTNIEHMHASGMLSQGDTLTLPDIIRCDLSKFADKTCIFNPMGMAVFDIAIAAYYYREALKHQTGTTLS